MRQKTGKSNRTGQMLRSGKKASKVGHFVTSNGWKTFFIHTQISITLCFSASRRVLPHYLSSEHGDFKPTHVSFHMYTILYYSVQFPLFPV